MPLDVLIVSLGTTAGLRTADAELEGSLRRAGAEVETVAVPLPRRLPPTMALQDLALARAARAVAAQAIEDRAPRAIVYSTSTAALLWPAPGAIRFDALSAGNRPGRHGLWQRPAERRRVAESPLLVPWSEGALDESPDARERRAVIVPVPVPGAGGMPPLTIHRDVAAVAYGANPSKKGLDRVLAAWERAHRPGERLVVLGAPAGLRAAGVEPTPLLHPSDWRDLLRRARVYVTAPRREDYGLAQLEALAEGAQLVTTEAPGPYAALPLARALDTRLVTDDLATALRTALDEPLPGYAEHAADLLHPWRREEVDRAVSERLLPALL